MTENQKAVLNLLQGKEMSLEDIAVELHSCNKRMKRVLANLVRNKYIAYDRDTQFYTLLIDYTPTVNWSFKELLGAWKI